MGANAQTSVPAFTAGQVLTAAQMTQVNTGIPVFASSTERDAAFGGTGEKTLAEGQYAFLENTNETQVYDGSTWVAVGASGLVLVSRTTVGSAVASVTVSGAFSSDYDNYRVVFAGSVGSVNLTCAMRLGATASGYKYAIRQNSFAGSGGDVGSTSASELALGGIADSAGSEGHFVVDVCGPNLAHGTSVTSMNIYGHPTVGRLDIFGGVEPSSTQHTAFTLLATTGTMTGGIIDVYGYAKA
jgi:hypothetical protein